MKTLLVKDAQPALTTKQSVGSKKIYSTYKSSQAARLETLRRKEIRKLKTSWSK